MNSPTSAKLSSDLAVVIPFFQREKGVLTRSLKSALAQEKIAPALILVVDDGSPIAAAEEIASLPESAQARIRVIVQKNAGPGAARNTALNALDTHIRYVAFLDSDDEWSPDHLANALQALRSGFDIYFSDLTHIDQSIGAFVRGKRIQPQDHPCIAGSDFLHAYRGDMLSQIATGNIIGTPTVVLDRKRFPALRFRPEFRHAGEDYLFWMELASQQARFAFSEKVEAKCGHGVNVYSGASWGTNEHLIRLINELRYRKICLEIFQLPTETAAVIQTAKQNLRVSIVRDLLYRFRRVNPPPFSWVADLIRTDPSMIFMFLPLALRLASGRQP